MNLKYQTRLTLIAAASAGLVIGLIFAALVVLVAGSEKASLDRDLDLGLDSAMGEIKEQQTKKHHKPPDFGEVVDGHPGLSLALFSKDGKLLLARGSVGSSLPRPAPHFVQKGEAVGDQRVVAAISSAAAEERIHRLTFLVALLWLPLTAAFALVIWWSGKSMFSPLAAMADQAAGLGDTELSFRLPIVYGGEYDRFTANLNGLLERIEASVGRQEQFAYDAAHELRTPLTIISAHLQERLREIRPDEADAAAYRQLLAEIERLTTLVNMLLESARMKADLSNASVEVSACLETSAARWLDRYTERRVELEVEVVSALVPISASELETVLDNLLSNALRASSDGQRVRLSNRRLGRSVEILVEDQGAGVPEARAKSIFDPFVRLDPGRNRLHGGMGLGLSICKRLIEDRSGTISVCAGDAGGAVFKIGLPLETVTVGSN